jgi:NTE family protein
MSRALVLGGGGPVGIGWQAGLLHGLAEAGVNLRHADFVLGTSAGSVVGAQLAAGRALPDLVDPFAQPQPTSSGTPRSAPIDLAELRVDPEDVPTEAAFLERFAVLAGVDWPSAFRCTSFDLNSSSPVVWDRASGIAVQLAVASSCSIPGISPPISIGDGSYIDGGARDMLNADLAVGYDVVVAVTCLPLHPPAGRMPDFIAGLLSGAGGRLDELRSKGAAVELVEPSADARELSGFGHYLMDFERTPAAFELGLEQGSKASTRIGRHWNR